jgi:arylsulfatase A-like enzyme
MKRLVALALLQLAACGSSAGAPVPAAPDAAAKAAPLAGQDCLIILLDALHAAHIGCYGGPPEDAPNIDRFAATGVRCDQARSNSSWTLPSTTTLFTGLFQETHGIQFDVNLEDIRLDETADTLAELFHDAGYDTAYLNQNPFAGEQWGLTQGFDSYRTFNEYKESADVAVDAAVARLSAPSTRPRFTYIHFRKPHTPFNAPPEINALFTDPAYTGDSNGSEAQISDHNSGRRRMTADDLRHHEDLFEANLHEVDSWLPRLFNAVDPEHTLVIVLADHGEAMGQHGMLGHNWFSWEEYIRIPMIFRHPAFGAGRVLEEHVGTVDVMPTLRELFGLRAPVQTEQGQSFASLLLQQQGWKEHPVFSSSRLQRGRQDSAVIDGKWKYIQSNPSGRELLFDLDADPGEQNDLSKSAPAGVMKALRTEVVTWRRNQRRSYAVAAPALDEATLDRLRQLGYTK